MSTNISAKRTTLLILICGLMLASAALPAYADPQTRRAQTAARIAEAETLLSGLGYWLTKADSRADASTRHAIIAFQKAEGLKRTGVLNEELLVKLRSATRPTAKHGGEAHVEIDLARQILLLVDDSGQVTGILPVSTGNGERYFSEGKWDRAVTPKGEFKIIRQIKGPRKAPLGNIYYPSYFHEGWAIHGSDSIPVKPASHGCARVPRFAEKQLSDSLKIGMPVFIY